MKTFRYHINDRELTIRLDDKQGTIADIAVDGSRPTVPDSDMPTYVAAIALALIEHEVEIVHDEEPGVITLVPHPTNWASPSELMCNL